MAGKSIFDCDSPDDLNVPQRDIIAYDDVDVFTFESTAPQDEVDNALRNVSISIKNDYFGTTSKRNADDQLESPNGKKKRKSHCKNFEVPTVSDTSRQANITPSIDEYTVIREIGCGTYGQVFKAQLNANRTVIAIKRLKCKLNTKNTDIELNFIKREYDNLLEMQDCANIVRLMKGREYQVSKDELRIDLLFEYCPHDLQKLIANKNIIFQLSEIKAFLRQILNGLNGMHSKMIMHRDFKTANILLTIDGLVRIADFGMSRKMSDPAVTLEKMRYTPNVVTQWYRAPEILLGDVYYNEKADMWSMGCVMGEFWQRFAILPGKSEIEQIKMISMLCGSMKADNWPNIVNLPGFKMLQSLPNDIRTTRIFLKDKVPKVLDDHVNDFFDKLMQCNPEKRLSAKKALNNHFFFIEPLPVRSLKKFMDRIIVQLRT